MSDDSRCCTKCGKTKPLSEFWKRKGGKFGRQAQCKDCTSRLLTPEQKQYRKDWYKVNRSTQMKKQREWYQKNREATLTQQAERYRTDEQYRESRKITERARKVGLNVDDFVKKYDELLKIQNGCCAICGKHVSQVQLVLDHRHSDMFIRGILCGFCNRAIGLLADSPDLCNKAALYLQ